MFAGPGKKLGQVKAPTITAADKIALAQFGKEILVCPPGGAKPRTAFKTRRDAGRHR